MKALQVFAGQAAYEQIQKNGLNSEQFKLLVGASGGPKWFVLSGLDRFLTSEYFKNRHQPLYTLGSSAGAWRFSCYAQSDPLAAINRLIDGYSQLTYPKKASLAEISQKSEQLLTHVLGNNGVNDICQNPVIKNNIVVVKSYGLAQFNSKVLQIPGLLSSAIANRVSRKNLGMFYQRVIMSADTHNVPFDYHDGIGSKVVEFTPQNVQLGLQATGAIPLVIKGVKDIPGAGKGMYRDGGIVDYHFEQPFLSSKTMSDDASENGLVLYPHFYNEFKPGWFDKYINHRFSNTKNFDKTVVLSPSQTFVDSLPYKKIPDRKDFNELTNGQRITYWKKVIQESERLADEFNELCHNKNPIECINIIQTK